MSAIQSGAQHVEQAFRRFATGVVLVCARHEGALIAARARGFNSVSLDPPLILWSLDKAAPSFAAFRDAAGFVVHILADDQEAALRHAVAPDASGPEWSAHPRLDLPIHGDCSAWFACEHVSYLDAGDHGIFVGEIRDCAFSERRPLVLCADEFHVPVPPPAEP